MYFPEATLLTAVLLAFSTFAVGFIARPMGGILAGHYGDRIGRKPMVVTCLLLMGAATFAIGCLPSADTVGVAAPILLALRFVRGLACGGQWGGIVLLLTESAGPKKGSPWELLRAPRPAGAPALPAAPVTDPEGAPHDG